jgi:hypothetical protein
MFISGKTCRLVGAAVPAFLLLLFLLAPIRASGQTGPDVSMALSKDSYWYRPGDTARLSVTLDNRGEDEIEDVSVRVRVHYPNRTRSDLDASFEGRPIRSYRLIETYGGDLTLKPGNNSFQFDLLIPSYYFQDGVYPLTLEGLSNGTVISEAVSGIIVMNAEEPGEYVPLVTSVVFDLREAPHRGPGGDFVNDQLAEECSTSGREPGWYATLVNGLEKWEQLPFTLALSPVLLEEIVDMTDGYTIVKGGSSESVGAGSARASDASQVAGGFQGLATRPRIQYLSTPYASCDVERLVSLGWADDARQQISLGLDGLDSGLGVRPDSRYFFPPELRMSTEAIASAPVETGEFLLLSPDLLQRTKEGREIDSGMTLGNPVRLSPGENGEKVAMFADARVQELVARLVASEDPQGVAQALLSELTNLFLERPERKRAFTLVWPNWWRPSAQVFEEVMNALSTAPWLHPATVAESFSEVPPLKNDGLEIPAVWTGEDEYFTQVGQARNRYLDFRSVVLSDNHMIPGLRRNLFISESDIWRQQGERGRGLGYAEAISNTVNEELAGVRIPSLGSVTLAGGQAAIPLSVLNETGYKIRATFHFSSNGLDFPDGDTEKVTLEPKENVFDIPVKPEAAGRVIFSATLESDRIVLAEIDIPVLTSRFNTFAIILVSGLLAIISVIWLFKVISRRKVGQHKKRQLELSKNE